MGQKVNPTGLRIGLTKDWRSRWFGRKADFGDKLHEDLMIRDTVTKSLKEAAISRVTIERFANRVRVAVHSARPGLVIGRKGAEIEKLKTTLSKSTGGKEIFVDIIEVKSPEVDATLVAQSIAQQLERRVSFRRAMKKALQTAMDFGADGIRIKCGGRLGGADLARNESYSEGKVPLQTLSANIDYGFCEANTLAGIVGIKVWICKSKNLEQKNGPNSKTGKVQKGSKRKLRR
ncbi:MAG: 30S ribosomal protein S3 [Lentisphaeraceae bacterium]|nr:30S ribosomal protein S3 [Lentisphaeraceae bacterium]